MVSAQEAPSALSPELMAFLRKPQPVLLTTVDGESRWPANALITWVWAKDEKTVRFASDARGRVMANVRADGRVLLTIYAAGACHAIAGQAKLVAEELQGVSLKLSCAEVAVEAVRDVTFWGGRITAEPQYDVTYDKGLKEKLDTAVFAALQSL